MKVLAKLNGTLEEYQKDFIQKTSFSATLLVSKDVKISGVLLQELVHRWRSDSNNFTIGSNVVKFYFF